MNTHRADVALRLVGIGWYVAICIGGGAAGGFWLDGRFDLSPIFALLGLCVGVVIAITGMYRMLMAVLATGSGPADKSVS